MGDIQDEVLRYWLKACPDTGGLYPSRSDMKVADLRHRMAFVTILDIEKDPLDFRYRLLGTRIRDFLYADYTGKSFLELKGKGPQSRIWKILDSVRTNGEPLYTEIPYVGPKADFKRASSLYLPLATDHNNIDKIMIITNFKRIQQIGDPQEFDPSSTFAVKTPTEDAIFN